MTEHLTEDTAVSDRTSTEAPPAETDDAALATPSDGPAAQSPEPTDAQSPEPTDAQSPEPTDAQSPEPTAAESENRETSDVMGAEPDVAPRSAAGGSRRQHLEREGEVAADFLETLLDICDLDGDIDVDIDGDRAAISVVDSEDGRVPRRLVGQDGTVLEALQEVTRLAVQSATGERSRLMLDVAGHRAERRRVLVEVAAKAIGEVKDSGERYALDPMTAFERKVVHDEVLAAGLVSESEGSEPRRFVVILPS